MNRKSKTRAKSLLTSLASELRLSNDNYIKKLTEQKASADNANLSNLKEIESKIESNSSSNESLHSTKTDSDTMVFDVAAFKASLKNMIISYDNDKKELKRFLSSVETAFEDIPDTSADTIPALLKFVVTKFTTGKIFEKLSGKSFADISSFKTAFYKAASSNESLQQTLLRLSCIEQFQTERVEDFANRIRDMEIDIQNALKAENFSENIINALTENYMKNTFITNLKPSLNIICCAHPSLTMDEAIELIEKSENMLAIQ
jgi:hypothetical protein